MSHDIFRDVARPPKGLGSQSWYTVPLSIVAHAAAVAVVVIVPLMATDVIPKPSSSLTAVVTPPPPPDPPPPLPVERRAAAQTTTNNTIAPVVTNPAVAPSKAADTIGDEVPGPPPLPGVDRSGPPAAFGGSATGSTTGIVIPEPPPVTKPVRPGGVVKYPEKVRDVRPHYPRLAIDGKVEGRVIIEAIIGVDGRVTDAKVLRSIPLLDGPALEAVRQWRFTPTLLNGVPVPVLITVTVDFKLN